MIFFLVVTFFLSLCSFKGAWAHALYEPLPDNLLTSLFVVKWDFDPTLFFFFFLGYFYLKGYQKFRGRVPVKAWQVICFYLGLTINILALLPPIDPLSDRLFFVHMIQHLMIVMLGIPLMLFGVPFYVTLRGLHPWVRRHIYFPIVKSTLIRKVQKILTTPLVSLAVFEVNFWFWHIPKYYNLALFNDVIHLLEHGCMAVSALYLWRNIIDPHPLKSPIPIPARMLYLAIIMALNIILSAALTYADTVWYAYEGIPQPSWWTYGYLEDQSLGGLIMWVPGGFLTFIAMTCVFFYWASSEQKKGRAAPKT